jgi:hypothetical protein
MQRLYARTTFEIVQRPEGNVIKASHLVAVSKLPEPGQISGYDISDNRLEIAHFTQEEATKIQANMQSIADSTRPEAAEAGVIARKLGAALAQLQS